jgi:dynein heavy chain 2, cytosolic
MQTIHKSAPASLCNPYRFVCFVHMYHQIFSQKQDAIVKRQEKLSAGISKLTEAQEVVKELRGGAETQEKELAHKQAEAAAALNMISETMQGANTQKSEMETLKTQTMKENEHLQVRKEEIDVELAEIEPLVQEAQAAVGNIKTEALSEIRSLRAPPEVIRDILEGVLRLMGIQVGRGNKVRTTIFRSILGMTFSPRIMTL